MKKINCYFYVFPIIILFLLGACSKEESFETDEGKVTIKEDKNKLSFKSEEGSLTIKGDDKEGKVSIKTEKGETIEFSYNKDSLPENFPKDVPIYLPSDIIMSQTIDNGKSHMASLNTKDDKSKVAEFYKKGLPDKGWKIVGEMSMGGMTLFQGEKEDKSLNVTINTEDGKTIISLVIGET